MTKFEDFIKTNKNDIYRFWVYKKVWTPYEIENKFKDQGEFEEDTCEFGKITNVIELPDDVLLEISILDQEDDLKEYGCKQYHKLSSISLCKYEYDNGRNK